MRVRNRPAPNFQKAAERRTGRLRLVLYSASAFPFTLLLLGLVLPLPHDPRRADASAVLVAPNAEHWFGTDQFGVDVFSMVVSAGSSDLPLAIAGTALSMVVGVTLGLLFAYFRRWGDKAMRLLDGFQALPLLIVILSLVALSGQQLWMVIIAISLFAAPLYIRLVRSEVLSLRNARFVEAAVACGASPTRIMLRHLLPNLRHVILAQTSLVAAMSLLAVAVLSYLGVGIKPPTPSWGAMISLGQTSMLRGVWWTIVFPGLALFLSVLAFNLASNAYATLSRRNR